MDLDFVLLAQISNDTMLRIGGILVAVLFFGVLGIIALMYGPIWIQAYFSDAMVSLWSLIGMSLRQVSSRVIVNSKVMAVQAGIADDAKNPITTRRLEAHYLAGGDVPRVVRALIAAHRADIDLDFDRAAAIDLAGRDVLDAVQTSVNPKVIDCPGQQSGQQALSAIAGNGVELKVHALVTVRTDISKLIGGATEDTVIARVGEGIITAIGSADSHETVLENPDVISKAVLARGLDAQTAFQIVSIDIKSVVVGANIGARIQYERAEAETRVARARAEQRRAVAVAVEQEGRARTAENRAALLKSESLVPLSIAQAFRAGNFHLSEGPPPASSGNIESN